MKKHILLAICLFTSHLLVAGDLMNDHHIQTWKSFIQQNIKIGTDIAQIDDLLRAAVVDTIIEKEGGSGRYSKVYRIDDCIQIRAEYSRENKLISTPLVEGRTIWRKYPDGTGTASEDQSKQEKPLKGRD